ncbi:uncharacterized protein, partial [Amphiura filiformis]|uniref:uncharacterized protein n=1 Tax=Amphiura filiformis TaxID=82378 RepID=UPI003B2133D3
MQLKVVDITESKKRQVTSSDDEGTTKGKSLLNAIKGRLKKSKKAATQSNTATTSTTTRPLSPTVKFSMGWMNFNVKRHEFTQVRSAKGGGSPTITMLRSSSYEDVLREASSTFFPGGKSSNYGHIKNMECHLADYRCNRISAEGWTLNSEYTSGTKLRLYLCTKIKNLQDNSTDDDDDDDLPDFGVGAGSSTEPTQAQAGHGREASQDQAGSSTEPTQAQAGHGREASQDQAGSTEPTQAQAGHGREA